MSDLRRQEEALVALSYPQVAYSLEGGYGGFGNYGSAAALVGSIISTGLNVVSTERQVESKLTAETSINQAKILAEVAINQQVAAQKASMAPIQWAIGGLLGVTVILGTLKATKVI